MTGPSPDPGQALGMADDALQKVRAAAAELGVTLPERQVVYFLPVPIDCDQVTVAVESWVPAGGSTDEVLQACSSIMWNLRLFLTITRKSCALPDEYGNAPTVAAMRESFAAASTDAEVLRVAALKWESVGQGEIQFSAPQGQFQDVEIALTIPMGW